MDMGVLRKREELMQKARKGVTNQGSKFGKITGKGGSVGSVKDLRGLSIGELREYGYMPSEYYIDEAEEREDILDYNKKLVAE